MKFLILALVALILWAFLGLVAVVFLKAVAAPRRLPAWVQLLVSGPLVWSLELSTWWHTRRKS